MNIDDYKKGVKEAANEAEMGFVDVLRQLEKKLNEVLDSVIKKEDDIKPCPFCGGPASVVMNGYRFYVNCEKCDCSGAEKYTEDDAVEAWNRRASYEHTD